MMSSLKIIYVFGLCLLWGSGVTAQTLEQFEQRLDQELTKIEQRTDTALKKLRNSYLGALIRLERDARQSGDLAGVESVRREIKRVESGADLDSSGFPDHGKVQHMQGIIRKQLKSIQMRQTEQVNNMVGSVQQFVSNRAVALTRENQIQQAKAWRDWGETIRERPMVAKALKRIEKIEAKQQRLEAERNDPANFHQALQGSPVELVAAPTKTFPGQPAAYLAGNEPQGKDKRLGTAKIPSAAGAGNTLLTSRVKLVEDESTLSSSRDSYSSTKHKKHRFVPRLEISPLPNKSLGRSLVVFDLYRRGSGSKREMIRTDRLLLPPLESRQKVVLDAGAYEYESYKYRTTYGYSSKSATAEEFYGYIVTMFDQDGEMFYQRATEPALEDYARSTPPAVQEGASQEGAVTGEERDDERMWRLTD